MKRILWAVPVLLLLIGCASDPTAAPQPTDVPEVELEPTDSTTPPEDTTMQFTCDSAASIEREVPTRFLALGDSYTIGESVPEADRWPVQLVAMFRQAEVYMEQPQIIARTGWTTDELNAAIDRENPQGPYQLVSLLIGVNNQYRGYPQDTYREEFAALLDRAIGYAGGLPTRVIVLSIPDWAVTPFGINSGRTTIAEEIDAYNAINKEISEAKGVHYVDVTPISREAVNDPALVADDGLHPSGRMYTEWAQLAFPSACEALSK